MKLRIVLVEPEGRINMGFILRLAKNFNVNDICVVNPKFNILDEEVLNFAAKGSELAGQVRIAKCLDECLKDLELSVCTTSYYDVESDVIRQSISLKHMVSIASNYNSLALVFGRESVGLTRSELGRCDLVMTIDVGSEYNVFNLSHAVAIVLYELLGVRKPQQAVYGYLSSREQLNYIVNYAKEIATALGLKASDVEIALKHVLYKALITKAEGRVLYRLFKSIYFTLKHCGKPASDSVSEDSDESA
ncbi:MAG: TrmH family RNA methyltransferase [Sulfolobales archaeon]